MKQLIEESTVEQFKAWSESVLDLNNPNPTGFHSGPDIEKIMDQMAESDSFKYYLHSGYKAYMISCTSILRGNTHGLGENLALELLHHDRVTAGFMMGFKYAMYLHEQQELSKLKELV